MTFGSTSCEYETELNYSFESDGTPSGLSLHPSGFQIALAFSDRVKLFHINRDTLVPSFELLVKKPTDVCFNHAGDLLGIAAMTSVLICDPQVPCLVNIFGGHLATINKLIFTDDDKLIISCGADGCVYGWQASSGPLQRSFEHVSKGTNYAQVIHDVTEEGVVCLTKDEGLMRIVSKNSGFILGEVANSCLSCLLLSKPTNTLFAGTHNGFIRAYAWPLDPKENNPYTEYAVHSAPIKALCTSMDDFSRIFSGCEKGTLMCSKLHFSNEATSLALATKFSLYRRVVSETIENKNDEARRQGELRKRLGGITFNMLSIGNDFAFVPKTMLRDKLFEIKELGEGLENLRNETDYTMAQKNQEINERIQSIDDERKREKQASQEKYDAISAKLAHAHKLFDEQCRAQAFDFEDKMKELDGTYDTHLSKEYEKQSRLVQEVQNMRDSHSKEILTQKDYYESQLSDLTTIQEKSMIEWKSEYDRMCNLLSSDESKFELAMQQQEEEYEKEIQELVSTKRSVLHDENVKNTNLLKESVKMKNNISFYQKLMKEKDEELKYVQKKFDDSQKKLQDMTDLQQKGQDQLRERDQVVLHRDESIRDLQEQQKHLEDFRFVLFNKVRALEEERDPLEEQVNSLQQSVQDMYGEMVRELRTKIKLEQQLAERNVKTNSLSQENKFQNNRHIQMKKDFNTIYSDVTELSLVDNYTDCSKLIRQIIKKFEPKIESMNKGEVKEDDKISLPLITEEVMRQRDILLRKSKSMADVNATLTKERASDARRMVSDNTTLISELNRLRAEKKSYQRRVKDLEEGMARGNLGPVEKEEQEIVEVKPNTTADTPYMRRKKVNQEQVYRLQVRKVENALPPPGALPKREERPEYVRKQPESLPTEDMPLETSEDNIYTGGPINPENSIPKMKPQASFSRK